MSTANQQIKNIFIYNASPADEVRVDGRVIKGRGRKIPDEPVERDGLRISFMTTAGSYERACELGMTDALDILPIDANLVRGQNADKYSIYGRRKSVTLEVV